MCFLVVYLFLCFGCTWFLACLKISHQTHLFWGRSPDDPELIGFLTSCACDYSCTYWLISPFLLPAKGQEVRRSAWMNEGRKEILPIPETVPTPLVLYSASRIKSPARGGHSSFLATLHLMLCDYWGLVRLEELKGPRICNSHLLRPL